MKRSFVCLALLAACGSDNKVGYYNTAPSVSIVSPPDGSSFDEGTSLTLEALVDDDFDAPQDLSVAWSSDRDGALVGALPADGGGLVTYTTANLSAGNHVITLQVVDKDGESAKATVSLTISEVPDAPEITIIHPTSGESGLEGEEFEFVATVSDAQDEAGSLVVSIESDADGVFCEPTPDGIGVASCDASLSGGDHVLTFTVTDSDQLTTEATTYFAVTSTNEVDDDGDGWTESQGDCNDSDASVSPGATEYYNGRDDDCDDLIDDGTNGYDDDGDGYTELDDDCDDGDASVYPNATEVYNATDDDCDSIIDEGTEGYDDDGDGYTEIGGDCDDGDTTSRPGATEVADGADNDCDDLVDEGTSNYDDDGDGYSEASGDCNDASAAISPGATESCGDGVDNDCDSTADEENASGCVTYYYDYDGDAYGSSTVAGRCLCTTTSYYTSRYNTDCYDYNANANPSVTTYYTTHRGDSSYDYNCDSIQDTYYDSTYSCNDFWAVPPCNLNATGWQSGVASCGASATWVTDCSVDWFTCDIDTTTAVQPCR